MAIDCCKGCVPPKRTPTCKFDGTCNRYAEAKEKHDQEKAVADKQRRIEYGLASQLVSSVIKANKAIRKKG